MTTSLSSTPSPVSGRRWTGWSRPGITTLSLSLSTAWWLSTVTEQWADIAVLYSVWIDWIHWFYHLFLLFVLFIWKLLYHLSRLAVRNCGTKYTVDTSNVVTLCRDLTSHHHNPSDIQYTLYIDIQQHQRSNDWIMRNCDDAMTVHFMFVLISCLVKRLSNSATPKSDWGCAGLGTSTLSWSDSTGAATPHYVPDDPARQTAGVEAA